MKKICKVCHKTKPNTLDYFYKQKTYKDGLTVTCKKCIKKYKKEYRIKNLERFKLINKKYYETHKHKRKIKDKLYYDKNIKIIRIKKRIYAKSSKGIFVALKHSAKERKIDFFINQNDFINWYNNQDKFCYYCKKSEQEINNEINSHWHRLTIDRKDNNKGYNLNNLVLCCYSCNRIKSNIFSFIEMIKIGKIIYNIYKERIANA